MEHLHISDEKIKWHNGTNTSVNSAAHTLRDLNTHKIVENRVTFCKYFVTDSSLYSHDGVFVKNGLDCLEVLDLQEHRKDNADVFHILLNQFHLSLIS